MPSGVPAPVPKSGFTSLTPFFDGTSDVSLSVTERINRPDDNAFEGAYQAWVGDGGAPGTEGGNYPLVFDAVDFAAFSNQNLPATCRARICGFCRELKAYTQSFFPVGLFAEAESSKTPKLVPSAPSSNALINGVIKGHRELVNEFTGQPFHWLEIESLSATYDIVAAPRIIEGEIRQGGIVQAACWLFGRILK